MVEVLHKNFTTGFREFVQIIGKCISSPKIIEKLHQNRPTNVDVSETMVVKHKEEPKNTIVWYGVV